MMVENWGEVPYNEATSRQLDYAHAVAAGQKPETLIVCTHPPVVTCGRGTKPGDIFGWGGEVVETSRGGRATYHGPSQIVIYPILNLSESRKNFKERDLHAYLRALEAAQVSALHKFDIVSEARTLSVEDGPSLTGVWVCKKTGEDKKIASIGIAVKKWITYHGLALNIESDPHAFSGINPCGFKSSIMTSVEEELKSMGRTWDKSIRSDFEQHLVVELSQRLA